MNRHKANRSHMDSFDEDRDSVKITPFPQGFAKCVYNSANM